VTVNGLQILSGELSFLHRCAQFNRLARFVLLYRGEHVKELSDRQVVELLTGHVI
jgi:hypothetical protein